MLPSRLIALADMNVDARLLPRRLLLLTDPSFDIEGARLARRPRGDARARLWGVLQWIDLAGSAGIAEQTTYLGRLGGEPRVSANLFLRGEVEMVETEQTGFSTTRMGASGSVGYRHRYFDLYLDLRRNWTESDAVGDCTDDAVYLRVTTPFRWGQPTPPPVGRQAATESGGWGRIEGSVFLDLDGLAAAIVPTGPDGRFAYPRVAAGRHSVRLIVRKLPADYDLVTPELVEVRVERRGTSTVDFAVQPLGRLTGRVVRIRVSADGRETRVADGTPVSLYLERGEDVWQTFADDDGVYAFENVRAGDYEIVLDPSHVPDGAGSDPPSRHVSLGVGQSIEGLDFVIRQPVRREIRNGRLPQAPPLPAPAPLPPTPPRDARSLGARGQSLGSGLEAWGQVL